MPKNNSNDTGKKKEKADRKNKKGSRSKKIHREWNSIGKHHVVPRSRGGGNNKSNIKDLDGRAHWCYHRLFGNLNPEESQLLLCLMFRGKRKKWGRKDIKKLQKIIQFGLISEAKKITDFGGEIEILTKK